MHDLVFAARLLRKNPGVTLVATLSLALAIGANTTIFSIAKRLLYDRLDVPDAASLRLLTAGGEASLSYPVYEQLRAHNDALGDLLAFHGTAANATIGDNAERVLLHEVSGNYYDVLGVQPQLGRGIRAADDAPGSAAVAVISDGLWARNFARSPAVLGQSMKLNDVAATIVGVNPRGFTGAASTFPSEAPDVLVTLAQATRVTPASNGRDWLADPASRSVRVMGRARSGVNDSAARASLDAQFSRIVRAIVPQRTGDAVPALAVRDGSRGLFEQQQTLAMPITMLTVFLALVLLLACANVATLMLARGARRRREISVRLALGASRLRILRQVLVESLLLAAIAGISGLGLAYLGRHAIAGYEAQFDWRVCAYAGFVSVGTGVLFGIAPAWTALRTPLASGVKPGHAIGGKAVVGFQLALATLLLVTAGLFVRSLAALTAVDPGFKADHLLLAQIVLPQNRYPAGANIAFHQRMEQSIAAIPGVTSVAGAEVPYLSGQRLETRVLAEGNRTTDSTEPVPYNAVGTRFFETLGIPILAGRGFTADDTSLSPKVAVINRRLAAARFPNENPIGKRISVGVYAGYGDVLTGERLEIVGVCGDSLYGDLRDPAPPQLFIPYVQQTQVRRLTYHLRTRAAPATVTSALRRTLHSLDPSLPLVSVRTQEQQIASGLTEERLLVTLTSIFGALGLVLAAVGIYALLAYSVTQRTREIGIRMALGALPRQILSMVLRECLSLSAAATALGAGAAVLAMRVVRSMLFGIAPADALVLFGAVALLMSVAVAASWLPARRAARVQPVEALRRES